MSELTDKLRDELQKEREINKVLTEALERVQHGIRQLRRPEHTEIKSMILMIDAHDWGAKALAKAEEMRK